MTEPETDAARALREAHEAIDKAIASAVRNALAGRTFSNPEPYEDSHAALDRAVEAAEPEELLAYRWLYRLTDTEKAQMIEAYREALARISATICAFRKEGKV